MRVLVSAASRHGATEGIGRAIAATLNEAGLDAVLLAPHKVSSVAEFDAAVIGSAVYMGKWLEPARMLVEAYRDELSRMPVWLFSSGPVGIPPRPAGEPDEAVDLRAELGARDHRVFPGLVDPEALGMGERLVVKAVRAPAGDYRPWEEIAEWASTIARSLSPFATVPS
jgi:menaquinone-dependent protoporphyrinogen oxidase